MTEGLPQPDPRDPNTLLRTQLWLHRAGWVVLVGGLSASVWAFRKALADERVAAATREALAGMQNTKRYEYQLEVYGGKANVAATELQQWFEGLWQGRQLAYTLAILAVGTALACFSIAELLPRLPPFPPGDNSPIKHRDREGS
jgi:hypothetical protein